MIPVSTYSHNTSNIIISYWCNANSCSSTYWAIKLNILQFDCVTSFKIVIIIKCYCWYASGLIIIKVINCIWNSSLIWENISCNSNLNSATTYVIMGNGAYTNISLKISWVNNLIRSKNKTSSSIWEYSCCNSRRSTTTKIQIT